MKRFFILVLTMITTCITFSSCSGFESTSKETISMVENPPPPLMCYEVTDTKCNIIPYDHVDAARIEVMTVVRNTGNVNIYLEQCKFDIYDESNKLIDVIQHVDVHTEVIAPGEFAVYYGVKTFNGDVDGNYVARPVVNVYTSRVEIIRYAVDDVTVRSTTLDYLNIIGTVTNNTDVNVKQWKVSVIMFDKDEKVLGAVTGYMTDALDAGEKTSFTVTHFEGSIDSDLVDSVYVVAYPHQYQIN